jgi:hypothetical protein
MIYKGDFPSFQCKMSLDRSSSMGEIDGLNVISIDFDVLSFMPRLHRRGNAL